MGECEPDPQNQERNIGEENKNEGRPLHALRERVDLELQVRLECLRLVRGDGGQEEQTHVH